MDTARSHGLADLMSTLLRVAHLQRRNAREVSAANEDEPAADDGFDDIYRDDGSRIDPPLDWGDPKQSLSRTEFVDVLQACLDELPVMQARAFLMRERLDFDIKQICSELNITPDDCAVLLHRARVRLRECLEKRWFATSKSRQCAHGRLAPAPSGSARD